MPTFNIPAGDTLTLPRGVLLPNKKYTVGVSVTNYLGQIAPIALHSLTTNSVPIPVVRIHMDQNLNVLIRGAQHIGSNAQQPSPTDALVLNSFLNFSSCHSGAAGAKAAVYAWTIVPAILAGLTPPNPTSLQRIRPARSHSTLPLSMIITRTLSL